MSENEENGNTNEINTKTNEIINHMEVEQLQAIPNDIRNDIRNDINFLNTESLLNEIQRIDPSLRYEQTNNRNLI